MCCQDTPRALERLQPQGLTRLDTPWASQGELGARGPTLPSELRWPPNTLLPTASSQQLPCVCSISQTLTAVLEASIRELLPPCPAFLPGSDPSLGLSIPSAPARSPEAKSWGCALGPPLQLPLPSPPPPLPTPGLSVLLLAWRSQAPPSWVPLSVQHSGYLYWL